MLLVPGNLQNLNARAGSSPSRGQPGPDRALPGRALGRSPVRKAAVPVPSEGTRRRLHFRAGAEAPSGRRRGRGVGEPRPPPPHRGRPAETKRMPQIPSPPRRSWRGCRTPARTPGAHLCLTWAAERPRCPPSLPALRSSPGLGTAARGGSGLGRRVRALTMRGGERGTGRCLTSTAAGGGCRAPRGPPPALREGGAGAAAIFGGSGSGTSCERLRNRLGRAAGGPGGGEPDTPSLKKFFPIFS